MERYYLVKVDHLGIYAGAGARRPVGSTYLPTLFVIYMVQVIT